MKSRVPAFLLCILLVTLPACFPDPWGANEKPPSSAQNLPLYPGAPQAAVRDSVSGRGPVQVTSFSTPDKVDAVLQFYKETLLRDHWIFRPELSTANKLYFGWHGNANQPAYELTVSVELLASGQTHVELTRLTALPE